MIYEVTLYQVVCDAPGCYEESAQSESESHAKGCARNDGFSEANDGKWFCSEHAPKRSDT